MSEAEPSSPSTPPPAPAPYRYRSGTCTCRRCRCRSLFVPIVLITLGVLFFIGEYLPRWDFGELWPVFLIVIGVLKLIEYSASTEGHRG